MDVLYVYCFKSVGIYKHLLSRIESLVILYGGINCMRKMVKDALPSFLVYFTLSSYSCFMSPTPPHPIPQEHIVFGVDPVGVSMQYSL